MDTNTENEFSESSSDLTKFIHIHIGIYRNDSDPELFQIHGTKL